MPGYIRDQVNLKDYKNLFDLTQQSNEVWEERGPDAGAYPLLLPCNKQSHYTSNWPMAVLREVDHQSQVLSPLFSYTGTSQRQQRQYGKT
jgi:hypothetical protein